MLGLQKRGHAALMEYRAITDRAEALLDEAVLEIQARLNDAATDEKLRESVRCWDAAARVAERNLRDQRIAACTRRVRDRLDAAVAAHAYTDVIHDPVLVRDLDAALRARFGLVPA